MGHLPEIESHNKPTVEQPEVQRRQQEGVQAGRSPDVPALFQEGWGLLSRVKDLWTGARMEQIGAAEPGSIGKFELCGTGKTPEDPLEHFKDVPIKNKKKIDAKTGEFELELKHTTWVDFPDGEAMLLRPNVSGKLSRDSDGTVHLTDLKGIEVYLSIDSRKGKGWQAESLTMRNPEAGKKEELELDLKAPLIPNQTRYLGTGHYDKSIAFFKDIGLIES